MKWFSKEEKKEKKVTLPLEKYIEEGSKCFVNKNYDEALSWFKSATEAYPKSIDAWQELGMVELFIDINIKYNDPVKLGNPDNWHEKAKQHLSKAKKLCEKGSVRYCEIIKLQMLNCLASETGLDGLYATNYVSSKIAKDYDRYEKEYNKYNHINYERNEKNLNQAIIQHIRKNAGIEEKKEMKKEEPNNNNNQELSNNNNIIKIQNSEMLQQRPQRRNTQHRLEQPQNNNNNNIQELYQSIREHDRQPNNQNNGLGINNNNQVIKHPQPRNTVLYNQPPVLDLNQYEELYNQPPLLENNNQGNVPPPYNPHYQVIEQNIQQPQVWELFNFQSNVLPQPINPQPNPLLQLFDLQPNVPQPNPWQQHLEKPPSEIEIRGMRSLVGEVSESLAVCFGDNANHPTLKSIMADFVTSLANNTYQNFKDSLDRKLTQAVNEGTLEGDFKDYMTFLFTQPENGSPVSTLLEEAEKNPKALAKVVERHYHQGNGYSRN